MLELNLEANTSNILYIQYMESKTRPGEALTYDESEDEQEQKQHLEREQTR